MSYAKLRGKIREIAGTQEAFAKAMGMCYSTLSTKLNGKSEWTCNEISKASELLGIDIADVHVYFFSEKVGKSQHGGV